MTPVRPIKLDLLNSKPQPMPRLRAAPTFEPYLDAFAPVVAQLRGR